MATCSLCDGKGEKIHVEINRHTKLPMLSTELCLCAKSDIIGEKYPLLRGLGSIYLPLKDIDKQLVFRQDDLKRSPNFLIQNTDFNSFCLHIKGVLMKNRWKEPEPPKMYLCKAYSILKNFFVEQSDGSNVSLHDLNNFDLLIFTLDTLQHNEKLCTCVSEVVNNRLGACIPTWIWLPVPLDNTRETSDELRAMLKPDSEEEGDRFKKIELKEKTLGAKSVNSKVKRKAETFKPSPTPRNK